MKKTGWLKKMFWKSKDKPNLKPKVNSDNKEKSKQKDKKNKIKNNPPSQISKKKTIKIDKIKAKRKLIKKSMQIKTKDKKLSSKNKTKTKIIKPVDENIKIKKKKSEKNKQQIKIRTKKEKVINKQKRIKIKPSKKLKSKKIISKSKIKPKSSKKIIEETLQKLAERAKVEWTPNMSMGEKTIDQQHKNLINYINKLFDEIPSASAIRKARDTLHFLTRYATQHFKYEENYMKKIGYPHLKNHHKIHQYFFQFLKRIHKKLNFYLNEKAKPAESTSEKIEKIIKDCETFLGKWLIHHIMKEDKKYYNYALSKGLVKNIDTKKNQSEKSKKELIQKRSKKISSVKELNKIHQEIDKKVQGQGIAKKTHSKTPKLDLAAIKAEIEAKIKSGHIKEEEGQIIEQRTEANHAIKHIKNHKNKANIKENIRTGVPGFDDLFEKGIPRGNSVIVAGGAGSGKTIFCLQTLFYHLEHGEKCFYMSFEESEQKLIKHMKDFGWDARKYIKSGKLILKRMSPFEITRSVDAMLAKEKGELLIEIDPVIMPKNFKPDIIALDSLTAIASAFTGKEDSYRVYIEQLFKFFENLSATSFLITETKQIPEIYSTTGVEEFLADGVIVIYNIKRGDVRENAIEVLKMRGEHHQKKIVAMQITEKGMIVYPEQEIFGGLGNGNE